MPIFTKKGSPFKYTRFTVTDKTTGRSIRVYESTRETTSAKAKEYEEKRKEDIKQQLIYGRKPRYTWAQAEKRWLEEMNHKRSIVCDVEKFEFLGTYLHDKYLEDINKDLIDYLVQEKQRVSNKSTLSPATINRLLALIKSVLNKAYKEWGWVEKPPLIKLKPENNARIRYLTVEELQSLLKELPPHLANLVQFSVFTGQRASNVLNLKWKDIDLNRKVWTILPEEFKTNKLHVVPLNHEALRILNKVRKDHPLYVFAYKGAPIKQCNTKAFRSALKRAGITDFKWHDLRHTWASWHVQSETPLQILQQLGGWKDYKMVLRYAHLDPKQLIKASNNITLTKKKHEVEDAF